MALLWLLIKDIVILVLLESSAAFDTVDYCKLLSRLNPRFGICDKALDWFRSNLSGRTQFVKVIVYPKAFPKGQLLDLSYTHFIHHLLETWFKHPLLCR